MKYKHVVYDYYAADDPRLAIPNGNEFLVWNIISTVSEKHFKVFDFGGAGDPNVNYGPREFKRSFGGQLVNYGRFRKNSETLMSKFLLIFLRIYKKIFKDAN